MENTYGVDGHEATRWIKAGGSYRLMGPAACTRLREINEMLRVTTDWRRPESLSMGHPEAILRLNETAKLHEQFRVLELPDGNQEMIVLGAWTARLKS